MLKAFGLFSLFLIALIGVLAYGANIYQWTDADGKVHYSDTPPSQTTNQQRTLNIAPPSTNDRPRSPTGLRPGELEMLRNLEEEQQATTPSTEPEESAETEQVRIPQGDAQSLEEGLCAKYSNLLENTSTAFEARQKAREALASGDYATYRALRRPRLRQGLRQEYQKKIAQHCQTP